MTTSTQAMNNVNKVQTPAAGNKPKQAQQESELNFTELFSSALGQSAPKAQLNSIETQLRESLYQQNKPKKNIESTANAEAAQAAQAAVWAQRNWMQDSPSQPSTAITSSTALENTEPAKQAVVTENAAEKSAVDSKEPANSATVSNTAGSNSPTASGNPEETPGKPQELNTEPIATSTLPPNSKPNVQAETLPKPTSTPPTELTLSTVDPGESADPAISKTVAEKISSNTPVSVEKTHPENKSVAQMKADATLANSSVQMRSDSALNHMPGIPGHAITSSQLNEQLAPQITQQIAQQAQAMGEGFGEEGLKVGQKILAAGNFQSTNTTTGIAAGTNGLTGTSGSVQQALIKTPVNQPGFAKELGQTVQWAIGKNLSTVDIRVNPESFGPMNMRLVQKGQQVQLVIRTQDEASANLLTQALGGLKEVLAQNGLQLNQVQIQHGNNPTPQGQSNNGQAQFDQNRNQGQGNGQHAAGGDQSQPDSGLPVTKTAARKPEGTLDLFA